MNGKRGRNGIGVVKWKSTKKICIILTRLMSINDVINIVFIAIDIFFVAKITKVI
jgi:hypothetical protein